MPMRKTSRSGGRHYSNTANAGHLTSLATYEHSHQSQAIKKATTKKVHFKMPPQKTVYKDVGQDKAKFSIYSILTIGIVFLAALVLALSCAVLVSKQLNIADLHQTLRTKKESNSVLDAQISKQHDLKEIERIATTKLGMSKPKSHQIIHINVPKQNYVVRPDSSEPVTTTEQTIVDKLKHWLNNR